MGCVRSVKAGSLDQAEVVGLSDGQSFVGGDASSVGRSKFVEAGL